MKYNYLILFSVAVICFEPKSSNNMFYINHPHHHVAPSAGISLNLSRYPSLSSIATGRSSCLHPVSAQSCSSMCRGPQEYVAYEFIPISPVVSHMSGSSNFDSFVMGGRWACICCLEGRCLQDLFSIAHSIPVLKLNNDKKEKKIRKPWEAAWCVVYWPWSSCQNRKCTCVNNMCIRSKVSRRQSWVSTGWIE